LQELSTFKVPDGFRGRSKWKVQLWWLVSATLFRLSPQVLYGWRRQLLRLFGARIGRNVIIRPSCQVTYPWKLTIGDYSWIGDDVVLYSLDQVTIGANVVVSQRSYLCTGSHDYTSTSFDIYARPITVEDRCWLATDVFVGPGVTVGCEAVIGARSSVFASVVGGWVYAGTPVRPIKLRSASS